MKNIKKNIILLMKEFNEKELKKLQVQQLLNLINKLEEHNIGDKKIFVEFEELISNLRGIKSGNNDLEKSYKKSYYKLKQDIQKHYGIVEKGTYIKVGLVIGMTSGICMGAVLSSSRSVSLSLGMIIGILIGTMKEKSMEKKGEIY